MADYFLVLDGKLFAEEIRPALGDAWRKKDISCCRDLCRRLEGAARDYAQRYHTGGAAELLVCRCAEGGPLAFDRTLWRALVGEVLLFAAEGVPEFPTDLETLICLLAPEQYQSQEQRREHLAPIQQTLRGSRDLAFSSTVYRPENAGLNDATDVERLARYLAGVRPESWTVADLVLLRGAQDEEEREEELGFAREWFPVLASLYEEAHRLGRVVVIERIY